MTEYLYADLLNLAIEQANVDLLVKLWSDVPDLDKEHTREIEKRITKSLPYLSKYYDLPSPKNFKEFVESYDVKMALEECGEGIDFCLGYFAKKGKLNIVRLLLKRGATNLNYALGKAGEGGSIEVINFLLSSFPRIFGREPSAQNYRRLATGLVKSLVPDDPDLDFKLSIFKRNSSVGLRNSLLFRAAFIGDRKLVDIALEEGASSLTKGAAKAAGGGHEDLMYYLLKDNKDKLGDCLEEAVAYGHLDLAKKLQDKVENYEKYMFNGAVRSGNLKLIDKYFSSKTALAMVKAASAQNFESIVYLSSRGVKIDGMAREMLVQIGEKKFFELIELPTEKDWLMLQMKAAEKGKLSTLKYIAEQGIGLDFQALAMAVRNGFKDVLEFLFEYYIADIPELLQYSKSEKLKLIAKNNEQHAILEYLNNL